MHQPLIKAILIALMLLGLMGLSADSYAQRSGSFKHGQARQHNKSFVVWDARVKRWVSPGRFWGNYSRRKGSRYWGRTRFYPSYSKVREHDLVTIVTKQGSCLMEFYHHRWRRANDVWRWNRRFNNYGGCRSVHRQRRSLFSF